MVSRLLNVKSYGANGLSTRDSLLLLDSNMCPNAVPLGLKSKGLKRNRSMKVNSYSGA